MNKEKGDQLTCTVVVVVVSREVVKALKFYSKFLSEQQIGAGGEELQRSGQGWGSTLPACPTPGAPKNGCR